MSPTITLILDLLIAGLLIATITYAIILNQQLIKLRESRGEMEGLIRSFNEATARAENGVKTMRRTAIETGEGLQKTVERAVALRDELQFMIEAGDSLARRLAETSGGARPAPAGTGGGKPVTAVAKRPPSEPRWEPDLNDVSQDLPRGRGLLAREFSPRPEPKRPAKVEPVAEAAHDEPARDRQRDLPRGRGSLTRGNPEPPAPVPPKSEPPRNEPVRFDQGRRGERAMLEDARPARRESGDGLSRAERELLEAMENRR